MKSFLKADQKVLLFPEVERWERAELGISGIYTTITATESHNSGNHTPVIGAD